MFVVNIPRDLQTGLHLECRKPIIGTQSQFIVNGLVERSFIEIGGVIQAESGDDFESGERFGLQLSVNACIHDVLHYPVVIRQIEFAYITRRSQALECVYPVEVEASVGFASVA